MHGIPSALLDPVGQAERALPREAPGARENTLSVVSMPSGAERPSGRCLLSKPSSELSWYYAV